MNRKAVGAAIAGSFTAMLLAGCVSQQQYDAVVAENNQLKAQLAQSQAEQKFVEAGDLLFPPGSFQLSPAGQAELANNVVPRLRNLQNAKIVVYGYTDNTPVGTDLQRQGIPDNLVLSTRWATTVARFLTSQELNPIIVSVKRARYTRPVAPTETLKCRAQNPPLE